MKQVVRSMTGFATAQERVHDQLGFTLSIKSVNHRFLDPHFRLPNGSDALEMEIRRQLKEYVRRGHVEVMLQVDRGTRTGMKLNLPLLREHVEAYRVAAAELQLGGEPDLNALMRLPGALSAENHHAEDAAALQEGVLHIFPQVMTALNGMREREGAALVSELRNCMQRILEAAREVRALRIEMAPQIVANIRERLQALLSDVPLQEERVLMEAAVVAERGDVEEETVRLETHVQHFIETLESGGEVGKRLDFLLQEFQREANTLLSKTGGTAQSLRITDLGLVLKTEIERAREQVQNLE